MPILFTALSLASAPWRRLGRRLHQLAQQRAMARRSRAELAEMGPRELSDLGIGRGDLGGLLDDDGAWHKDRR